MTTPDKRPAYEPVERLLTRTRYDPGMRRPATITAGALLVLLRVVAGGLWLIEVSRHWSRYAATADAELDSIDLSAADAARLGLVIFASVIGLVLLVEAALAVAIWFGRNVARVVVMVFAVVSISTSFAAWWAEEQEITLRTSLLSLGLDILILLALSSRSAAAYARRRERS